MMATPATTRLSKCLRAVHGRAQRLNLSLGLASLVAWITVLFLACFAIDWWLHLPFGVRILVLPLLLGYPLYRGWVSGWRLLRTFRPAESALQVEEHYQGLESLLVSGVQLQPTSPPAGTSAALSALAVQRADEAAADLAPRAVVPFDALRRPALKAGLLAAALVAMAVVNTPLFLAAVTRIFTPWQAASYPTRTLIELADAEIVVKEGDPVSLVATITGEIPSSAKLSMRTGRGKPYQRSLEIADGVCEYNVDSAFRSFDYSVSAGDAETGWRTVRVIPSPRVAQTRIRLVYPEYMNRPAEALEAMTLTVPEGTGIEWDLRLDAAVTRAGFSMDESAPVPLEVSEDGLTVKYTMEAKASGAYAFSWVDKKHNFHFKTAKHYLQVVPDQPPQVELTSPRRDLFATLGREMVLKYRARDDHGIGQGRIIYRRGNAGEKAVDFAAEGSEGRGSLPIDWDYRKAIDGLDLGESVSFAVEVSDRYPLGDGAHRVRSEFRRVTFLSPEDYLAKMHEAKERLLSQLRAVYRQERKAYEAIRSFDPQDDAFEQACFLESARQDILVERLELLDAGISDLLADLEANNITDRSEFEGLTGLRKRVADISKNWIGKASSELMALGPSTDATAKEVAATARTINMAARELGGLVLKLGVHEAMEVFAMELHVIAESQSILRLRTIESSGGGRVLAVEQRELAAWVDRLLSELDESRDYSKAPLAIVRLARMIKALRDAGIETSMQSVATQLEQDSLAEAVRLQKDVIADIFVLECNIRVGSEYEALLKARDLFVAGIEELGKPADEVKQATSADLAYRMDRLHRHVRLLILPPIPAPEGELLAEKPTEVPPVEALINTLQDALARAVTAIKEERPDEAGSQRQAAVDALTTLSDIVTVRFEEISRVARYAGHAGTAMERLEMVRKLFADQMRLSEKAEDAEYEDESPSYLAPSQMHLSEEVLKMRERLERKSLRRGSVQAVAPMLRMLTAASEIMVKAAPALKEERIDDALDFLLEAEDSLKAAMGLANHEANAWMGLANLIMTAEGVALPARYMGYIVDEQRDLIAATKSSTPETRKELIDVQKNLALAVLDVSVLLAGTGSALDFEQAMLFAGSDMGLSVQKLEAGDVAGAMSAQRQAVLSVEDLHAQFMSYEKQFHYFVTAMEFLRLRHGEAVAVLDDLGRLRKALENDDRQNATSNREALAALGESVNALGTALSKATGSQTYPGVQTPMARAIQCLADGDRGGCLDALTATETALGDSITELRELMTKVAYVPSVDPIEAPPEYNVMLAMVSLVLQEKQLLRKLYGAHAGERASLVAGLRELEATASDLVGETGQHRLMVATQESLAKAATHLEGGSGDEALAALQQARTTVRQCVMEYALYYVEIPRPRGSRRRKRVKVGPSPLMFKMSLFDKPSYDKNYGGVEGEDGESGRSEWEVLGRRDRAALNENFVRELPLEYREFLKDYYERLAE